MNNKIKYTGIICSVLIIIFYVFYLIILPNIININNYKSEIQKIVKENSNLSLNFTDAKLITTPMLSVGLTIDDVSLKLPDDTDLLSSDNVEIRLALPSLLFKTVKIPYAKIENPKINIDIKNSKNYAVVEALENFNNTSQEAQKSENVQVPINDYKVKIDKLTFVNYVIAVNDKISNHSLFLKGNDFSLGFDGKHLYVKTNANFYSDNDKNITVAIDVQSYIPQFDNSSAQENEPTSFINPVELCRKYNLKSDIVADLKIKEGKKTPLINGILNISDTTLKIGSIQLPKSYMQLKFEGEEFYVDTNLFIKENEHARLTGLINYSEKPKIDINVNSDKLYLSSILNLSTAVLDSLNMPNDLEYINVNGYLKANAKIKTDYKTLKSDGSIELINGAIFDKKSKLNITNMKALLLFSDNNLKIQDTQASINGTPFIAEGTVKANSDTDIKIYTKNLPIAKLYSTFAPYEIKKQYNLLAGLLSFNIDLKGKIKELAPVVNAELVNVVLKDRINDINLTNGLSKINLKTDFKKYKGQISNSNLVVSMPSLSTLVRNSVMKIDFDDKNIVINPSDVVLNGTSKFNLNGKIRDYTDSPDIEIYGKGSLKASDIKNLAGNDLAPFISAMGYIPVKMAITGSDKKQNALIRLYGSHDAYVSPVKISQTDGKLSAIQINADLENNKLLFKQSGLFTGVASNIKENISGKQLVSLAGTVNLNNQFMNLKISTPSIQNISVNALKNSSMNVNANIAVTGHVNNPKLNGNIEISNLLVPELYAKLSKGNVALHGTTFGFDLNNLNLNESLLNISGKGMLDYKPVTTIYDLKISSNNLNSDKVIKVSEATAKVPALSSGSSSSIPVKINSGNVDIKQLTSGDMLLTDIKSKIRLLNNIVYLNDFSANAYGGNLKGDISMNLITSAVKANVEGNNMNADATVTNCAGMKNTIYGTLSFDSDLSLKGSTYEQQMKSLNGKVNFNIVNGQFGTFGRFENFLKADNLASIAFLATKTGTLINKVSPHNTAEFAKVSGNVSIKNGVMTMLPITSSGKNMSMYITGTMNLLTNQADMQVMGRISQEISSLLGPINQLNPTNILKSTNTAWGAITVGILKAINQASTPSAISKIPSLTPIQSDTTTSKFIVKINGNLQKPQSSVKSFRWLSAESDIEKAQTAINPITSVKEVINSIPKTKEETVSTLKEAGKNTLMNIGKQIFGIQNQPTSENEETESQPQQ